MALGWMEKRQVVGLKMGPLECVVGWLKHDDQSDQRWVHFNFFVYTKKNG